MHRVSFFNKMQSVDSEWFLMVKQCGHTNTATKGMLF